MAHGSRQGRRPCCRCRPEDIAANCLGELPAKAWACPHPAGNKTASSRTSEQSPLSPDSTRNAVFDAFGQNRRNPSAKRKWWYVEQLSSPRKCRITPASSKKARQKWGRVAVDAVQSEPVSIEFSLLTGNLQVKFANLGRIHAFSRIFTRFP